MVSNDTPIGARAAAIDPRAVDPVGTDRLFHSIITVAASCFIGALVTDIVYARSPEFVWVTFSVWLITIGLIVAAIAALVGLVDRVVHKRLGTLGSRWPYLVGIVAAVVVSIFNALVHSRDAYQAVVPDGITLSAVAVLLLLLTPLAGRVLTRTRSRETL